MPWESLKREILFRSRSKSNQEYGKHPSERTIPQLLNFGIINLNKPEGPSSHQVSAHVQQVLSIKRSGHSGTLDPKVTGVLPVALGRATRITQALLVAGKEYVCMMHLHKEVPEQKIREVLAQNVGKIRQLPPVKSAVKRRWRFRKIYYLDILEIKGRNVLFRVGCQAGTYIRKLCSDVGDQLGVGAHMEQLIRTKAGPFTDKDMVSLQDLRDALWYYVEQKNEKFLRYCIRPIEDAVGHLPKVWVLDSTVDSLCHGVDLKAPGIAKCESDIQIEEMVAVLSPKGELIGLGKAIMISRQMINEEKGIAVKMEKVFMLEGVYPKYKKEKSESLPNSEQQINP